MSAADPFDSGDLGRVRVAAGPDPMWEIVLSMHRLRRDDGALPFQHWRHQVSGRVPGSTRLLADLMPARIGYFADFLTPVPVTAGLEAGLESLRSTPRRRLRADLSVLAARQSTPLPGWTGRLADGSREVLEMLAASAGRYFDACLAQHWRHVQAAVKQERLRLARVMADGGVERALRDLHPTARWQSPVLELAYPVHHELRLGGRGLTLIPSFFCWGAPITFRCGDLQPVLVYPIEPDIGWAHPGPVRSLATLLGRTRAAVLESVADGSCTTSELAGRTMIPVSTASQQATVLRTAGLIATRRTGQAVRHSVTPLGIALLAGGD